MFGLKIFIVALVSLVVVLVAYIVLRSCNLLKLELINIRKIFTVDNYNCIHAQ